MLKRVKQKTKNKMTALLTMMLLVMSCLADVSVVKVSDLHTVDGKRKTWYEYVENTGSVPIDALIATFHCKGTGGAPDHEVVSVYDSLYYYVDKQNSIRPGGRIALQAADPAECPGNVNAVVFSNGQSEGNSKDVDAIYYRRRGVYKALEPLIQILDGIAVQKDNRDHAIIVVQGLMKAAQDDLSMNQDERAGMIDTYNKMLVELRSPAARHSPRVDEAMISDNVTREQGFAIVFIKFLKLWQASLEGKLNALP